MIGERFGHFLDKPLAPLAKRVPLSPNVITISGFIVTVLAAIAIQRSLVAGGLLILAGGAFDMLDGMVARASGTSSTFGAFLDSTLDRYADAVLFLAVAWYFYTAGNDIGMLLSIGSLAGAFIISYARARAEGLGIDCKVGLLERPERVILLALGCLTGLLLTVVTVIFVLSHFTVVQRIVHVKRRLKNNL
ncbi:MAG TPA: CDP-alcohol phosphatidyltransferase family protein [Dissulfurispiraceae bacterium]|nr:CDP-alcohol phosphatidyltransferase family protein [Dissulfurispiraceae bacterium]